jgi:hypothetical protein
LLGTGFSRKFSCEKFCGGEGGIVGEHLPAIIFDLETYPEPKILSKAELGSLIAIYGTTVALAKFLGCSQAHVWERLYPYRSKSKDKN